VRGGGKEASIILDESIQSIRSLVANSLLRPAVQRGRHRITGKKKIRMVTPLVNKCTEEFSIFDRPAQQFMMQCSVLKNCCAELRVNMLDFQFS
jgi:hypothetical protein